MAVCVCTQYIVLPVTFITAGLDVVSIILLNRRSVSFDDIRNDPNKFRVFCLKQFKDAIKLQTWENRY